MPSHSHEVVSQPTKNQVREIIVSMTEALFERYPWSVDNFITTEKIEKEMIRIGEIGRFIYSYSQHQGSLDGLVIQLCTESAEQSQYARFLSPSVEGLLHPDFVDKTADLLVEPAVWPSRIEGFSIARQKVSSEGKTMAYQYYLVKDKQGEKLFNWFEAAQKLG